jgi:hypothetical protein
LVVKGARDRVPVNVDFVSDVLYFARALVQFADEKYRSQVNGPVRPGSTGET